MLVGRSCPYPVRHRIDDLENPKNALSTLKYVRHRIDDLEKIGLLHRSTHLVRHRIDDLAYLKTVKTL